MALRRFVDALLSDPERLGKLLEQAPVGIALHDETGKLVLANARLDALVGGRPEGVAGYRLQTLSGDALPPDRNPLARALQGDAVERTDYVVLAPNGTPRRLRLSAFPVGGEPTKAGGVVITVSDAEEGGDALQKDVLGIVGHDLRNPLSAIRMTAQLLARPTPVADERRRELAERILSSSKRMDNIVGALLDYARAKIGAALQLGRGPVDLEALVRRLAGEQEATAQGRSIGVEVRGDAQGSWDAARLEQVVQNLLANAVVHGEPGTPISVVVDGTAPDRVELSVHNQGPPIPPELQVVIFEPFKTGRPSGRRGLGLGLYIAKHLVEAHGGTLSVRSADADGTRFSVALPRG
jgi:PAS domain S-box-containing protein